MVRWLAILAVLFVAVRSFAVELNSVTIDYNRFVQDRNHEALLQQIDTQAKEGINLGLNIELARGVHWDNWARSLTDSGGYRGIGWEFRLYTSPFPSLDVGYRHYSRHLIDRENPLFHFPVEDSLEIMWKIYMNPKPHSTWWGGGAS